MPRLAGRLGKEFVFHGYTLRPPDSSGGFPFKARGKKMSTRGLTIVFSVFAIIISWLLQALIRSFRGDEYNDSRKSQRY